MNSFYSSENIRIVENTIGNQETSDLLILICSSIVFIIFFDKLKIPRCLLSGTLVAVIFTGS